MSLVVFRSGIPIAVPDDYASAPAHRDLVERLNGLNRFADAVAVLEQHPDGYLSADVLTGAPWAQRYLNTMARLWSHGASDRGLGERGARALMGVLAGVRPKVGRRRLDPLSPSQTALGAAAIAKWRVHVDASWPDILLFGTVDDLARHATLSKVHVRALRRLLRRRGLRKVDIVLTLASWETNLPIRRLRLTRHVADMVYG